MSGLAISDVRRESGQLDAPQWRAGSAATLATPIVRSSASASPSNQLACLGSQTTCVEQRERSVAKKPSVVLVSNWSLGGSCRRRMASLSPSSCTCSRKRSSDASQPSSFCSWLMVLGIFTEKRKCSGTASRQRCQVEERCRRWNELLISTTGKKDA